MVEGHVRGEGAVGSGLVQHETRRVAAVGVTSEGPVVEAAYGRHIWWAGAGLLAVMGMKADDAGAVLVLLHLHKLRQKPKASQVPN